MSAALKPALREAALLAGTRASPLALVQTRMVLQALRETHRHASFDALPLATTGDMEQQRRLADLGGKGLFAKEIHEALLDGRTDFAVHSLKDLETELPQGLVVAAVLPRADVRDALVLAPDCPHEERHGPLRGVPAGARIGTASARRTAQLRHLRPDLRFALIRGNVQTRLRHLESGDFAGTALAMAGLRRLGLERRASLVLEPDDMLPAAGQGIIAVTARAGDTAMRERLAAINDEASHVAAIAERAFVAALDGSCRSPIGAFARVRPGGRLLLSGLIAREDGSFLLRRTLEGAAGDARRIGAQLGREMRADSPKDVFA